MYLRSDVGSCFYCCDKSFTKQQCALVMHSPPRGI